MRTHARWDVHKRPSFLNSVMALFALHKPLSLSRSRSVREFGCGAGEYRCWMLIFDSINSSSTAHVSSWCQLWAYALWLTDSCWHCPQSHPTSAGYCSPVSLHQSYISPSFSIWWNESHFKTSKSIYELYILWVHISSTLFNVLCPISAFLHCVLTSIVWTSPTSNLQKPINLL